MTSRAGQPGESQLMISTKEFFTEMVSDALGHRKIQTYPMVKLYLVDLLDFYVLTENLYDRSEADKDRQPSTLAEMYLTAANSESNKKRELLKRLGDTALYVSGFFGDSLQRKLVDIDYYAEIGGSAYGTLAHHTLEDNYAMVFKEFSKRFMDYVDVLTYISQKALVQNNKDLLRLYDRYLLTGSKLAEEQLLEKGLLPSVDLKKTSDQ
ncbi:MAG: hypothetical protein H6626_11855 [Pseudobdellovibrionaceae bacterium]|nr:hypothetical protein [Bdellovibrionales bacterium]USN46882.1 MAG: hypothetical protein H6626_11855 [Pseudobdellovibrionaceae bacterium]